jgi:multicomponent Na+:H+ antiporter subunit E
MSLLSLNLLLAIAWIALTGAFTPTNLLFGFALSYALLWATRGLRAPSGYFTKMPRLIGFVLYFAGEMVVASVRVARVVLTPRIQVRPAVVAIPLTVRSPAEITLLANLISLTPGSLFLDVSQDRCVIYVHTMHVDDIEAFRADIKNGFERRVMEVLR